MCRHSADAVSYGGFVKLHLLIIASSSLHKGADLRLEKPQTLALVQGATELHHRPPGPGLAAYDRALGQRAAGSLKCQQSELVLLATTHVHLAFLATHLI